MVISSVGPQGTSDTLHDRRQGTVLTQRAGEKLRTAPHIGSIRSARSSAALGNRAQTKYRKKPISKGVDQMRGRCFSCVQPRMWRSTGMIANSKDFTNNSEHSGVDCHSLCCIDRFCVLQPRHASHSAFVRLRHKNSKERSENDLKRGKLMFVQARENVHTQAMEWDEKPVSSPKLKY